MRDFRLWLSKAVPMVFYKAGIPVKQPHHYEPLGVSRKRMAGKRMPTLGLEGLPEAAGVDRFIKYREGVQGKNGANLVAYQHIRTRGEKWSRREYGIVEAKISDFERANNCDNCGRQIVHVFWVRGKDGRFRAYGRECLHDAMGWEKPVTDVKARNLILKLAEQQQYHRLRKEELLRRANTDLDAANSAFWRAQGGFRAGQVKPEDTTLLRHADGRLLRVTLPEDVEIMREEGFEPFIFKAGIPVRAPHHYNRLGEKRRRSPGKRTGTHDMRIIPYTSTLDIRNVGALPRGTGARYLIAIHGEQGVLVAKRWARVLPTKPSGIEVAVDFRSLAKSLVLFKSAFSSHIAAHGVPNIRDTYHYEMEGGKRVRQPGRHPEEVATVTPHHGGLLVNLNQFKRQNPKYEQHKFQLKQLGGRWTDIQSGGKTDWNRAGWLVSSKHAEKLQEAMPHSTWEEASEAEVEREQKAAQAQAALSDAERNFKADVLSVPPSVLRQTGFSGWFMEFLTSNRGKSRDRLSAKQLKYVDEAQERMTRWLVAHPDEKKAVYTAWSDANASKVATAKAEKEKAQVILQQQESAEDFRMPGKPDISVLANGELFEHQKKGVLWLQKVKRGILAFSTGVGKTYSAIVAAVQLQEEGKAKRCLFVVPKARLVGTVRAIEGLYPGKKVVLIGGTPTQRAQQYQEARDADFVVAGYSMIQKEPEKLKGPGFDIVINDECVRLKGRNSETALNAKEHFSAPYIWDLSATPIPNSPNDLYNLMRRLQPALLGSKKDFEAEHCNVDTMQVPVPPHRDKRTGVWREGGRMTVTKVRDYKDKAKTREVVAPYIMARNWESADVNVPMTQRRKVVQMLDMDSEQRKLYERMRADGVDALSNVKDTRHLTSEEQMNLLTKLLRMEQISISPEILDPTYKGESPKIEEAVQIARDHFHNGETRGVAIYSHFLPTMDILKRELLNDGFKEEEVAIIKGGGTTAQGIQDIVDGMNAGKYKVLLASDAAAEGLDLQGNTNLLVHMDIPWRPDMLDQREGRIYRPGQKSDVAMIRLQMNNDVERHKAEVVDRKAAAQRAIVEGSDEEDVESKVTYDDFLKMLGVSREEVNKERKKARSKK